MNNTQTAYLLGRIALRDRRAFDELYDVVSPFLLGVCIRILKDRQEAEDALQESFIKIWNKASAFSQREASALAWIASVARNTSIDRLRTMRTVPVDDERFAELEDPDQSAEDRLMDADNARMLMECLDELEPKQASAVRMAYFTGRTYADLARGMETPLGTVKSWVHRSLNKLRNCLDPSRNGDDPGPQMHDAQRHEPV